MAYIKKEFIEYLVQSIDIVQYFSQITQIDKAGSYYKCKSLFKDENTASCMIKPSTQTFTDYSSQISGNVITLVMEYNKLNFHEAVEQLAKEYSKEVQYEDEIYSKAKEKRRAKLSNLRPLLRATLKKYQEELKSTNADKELKKREYTINEIAEWGIGYAPGEKFIYNELSKIGKVSEAKEIGLISDKNYDKYWDRLIYPIHDINGLLIGFAGRDLSNKDKMAKWINPSASDLYQKEKVWYGMHKAKTTIIKKQEAWIVEGYNDVIAWHKYGIENTISPCGTAITEKQLNILKKYTSKIIFCMDDDKAGVKSMLKYIPIMYKLGFSVDVCILPGMDPDDFSREFYKKTELKLPEYVKEYTINSFNFLMQHLIKGTPSEKSEGINQLCSIINLINDIALKEIYTKWLIKESGVSKSSISAIFKDIKAKLDFKKRMSNFETYEMPKGVTTPLEEILPDIKQYGMFQANNRIYMINQDDVTFKYISNFSIEIIQHMNDDKFPKKLVKVANIHGVVRIFDTDSANFNSPLSFKNAITAHGNFKFKGQTQELEILTDYLFDKMGNGKKIDVLGWQPEAKCWIWNNGVKIPGQKRVTISENGVIVLDNTSYYIPSANEVYRNSVWEYQSQKRFITKGESTFNNLAEKLIKVHREHAISGLLFSIASIHQDLISNKLNFFPILFLYGPASSGKSQLATACQGFFGDPQSQTNLENAMSTGKASIRAFAQFSNSICVLNEYKNGDKNTDGTLKGLWDRQGYNRGNLDSKVSTETVPILSSPILTGNYYPQPEALITRLISEEMTKDTFSSDEKKSYEDLEDLLKMGISNITDEIIDLRSHFEEKFVLHYRNFKKLLSDKPKLKEVKDRMLQNVSVLGAAAMILEEKYILPFSREDMINHFENIILTQWTKLSSNGMVSRFWDIFLFCIRRSDTSKLQIDIDYNTEGSLIFFNFTNVYNRVQTEWWSRFHEPCPGKTTMKVELESSDHFVEKIKSKPLSKGAGAPNTSVHMFNMKNLENYEEIVYTIDNAKYNLSHFSDSPATPLNYNSKNRNDGEMPF